MAILSYAILCALFASARADGGFQADSLVKAELAFFCIYAFLYVCLTALCLHIILRAAGRYAEYNVLFLSLAFATIGTISSIFTLVIRANGITPSPSRLFGIIATLQSLSNFVGNLSIPLLFLSICLIIRDRHLALLKPSTPTVFPLFYCTLFALFMIFSIVQSSYYAYYQSILYTNRISGHTLGWLVRRVTIVNDLYYTYSALWYLSALVVLVYSTVVSRQMRVELFRDKTLRLIVICVVPPFVLWAVEAMILTILTSPSGLKIDPFVHLMQLEAIQFSSVFLGNLFNVIVFGVLVALGYTRKTWQLESKEGVTLLASR